MKKESAADGRVAAAHLALASLVPALAISTAVGAIVGLLAETETAVCVAISVATALMLCAPAILIRSISQGPPSLRNAVHRFIHSCDKRDRIQSGGSWGSS